MTATTKALTSDDGEVPLDIELDYSKAVRGRYFERAVRAKNLVRIDDDVLAAFPTSTELNSALRALLEASKHVHVHGKHQ